MSRIVQETSVFIQPAHLSIIVNQNRLILLAARLDHGPEHNHLVVVKVEFVQDVLKLWVFVVDKQAEGVLGGGVLVGVPDGLDRVKLELVLVLSTIATDQDENEREGRGLDYQRTLFALIQRKSFSFLTSLGATVWCRMATQ